MGKKIDEHLQGVTVMDTDLLEQTLGVYVNSDGRPIILLKKGLDQRSRLCILAEEVGHYVTTVGDITDQAKIQNVKQELTARRWAYDQLIEPGDIIMAIKDGADSVHALAEYLEVTEDFLVDALAYLKTKKGPMIHAGDDVLIMEPLRLLKGGDPLDWITA